MRWPATQGVTRNVSRGSEDTSVADREQSAGSAGSKVWNWKRIQMRIGEATMPRGDHERLTLSQGVDQEAASGIAVFRRE